MPENQSQLTDALDGPSALGAANALDNTPTPGQWLKLAEYGDWPHPAGLQRFTQPAAEAMVRGFQSLWGRLRRRFGGVPVYVGHPDDPAFAGQAGHDDTRAYAWITSLEARPDGLYVLPRWSEPGRELLRNAFYKFLSPRWQMRPLGSGTFEPIQLISVGLTNHPNIPGESIANQKTPVNGVNPTAATLVPATSDTFQRLLETLELDPAASPETLLANAEQLAQSARDARSAQTESARFYRLATDADVARQAAEQRMDEEHNHRIDLLLDLAELRGRIRPAERKEWRDQLGNDFDRALLDLTNSPVGESMANGGGTNRLPLAGTLPLTARLATRRPHVSTQADADRFLTLVNERMSRTGEDYATAFARAKREHTGVFRT